MKTIRILGNMKEKSQIGNLMVKEHQLTLMEKSILGNGKMGKNMVKEHSLHLMEQSM